MFVSVCVNQVCKRDHTFLHAIRRIEQTAQTMPEKQTTKQPHCVSGGGRCPLKPEALLGAGDEHPKMQQVELDTHADAHTHTHTHTPNPCCYGNRVLKKRLKEF